MNRSHLALLLLASSLALPKGMAQSPGSVDSTFDTGSALKGGIEVVVPAPDGKFYIGGGFSMVPGALQRGVARLNSDGSVDSAFHPDFGLTGATVRAISVQSDGKIIIGGDFTTYGGTTSYGIARLNSDGSLDTSFDPGTGTSSTVFAVALQSDGKVVIGGSFTTVNGTSRNRIARLNSNGSLDTSFNPGTGASGAVNAIAVQADGKVIIGGSFTTFNGSTRNNIARLTSVGGVDGTFASGTGASAMVNSITLQSDGKALIGGDFTTYAGSSRNRIARLQTGGSLDTSFNPGTGINSNVKTIAVQSDGKVLIGGSFSSYDGTVRIGIVRALVDGSLDTSFTAQGASGIRSVVALSDGKSLAAGTFAFITGEGRLSQRIVRYDASGAREPDFSLGGTGADDSIRSIGLQPDGKMVLGGELKLFGGQAANHLLRLDGSAAKDASFVSSQGTNDTVLNSVVQADGKVLIAGYFTAHGGSTRNRVARVNSDGTLDTSFDPGTGADGTIYSMVLQPDGKVLIGGEFTSFNGTPRSRIARLNSNGSLDTSFNPGTGGNQAVSKIALQSDGKILIGGLFTSFNGTSINRITRLNSNGSQDVTFNPGTGASNTVETIQIQPDGKILICGLFTTFNGISRNRIARLESNGALDVSFDPGTGANSSIFGIELQADGKVLIGGVFTAFNGVTRNRIARLNANGSLDASFDPGTGADGIVTNVAAQADGRVLVAGFFNSIDGTVRSALARLHNDVATQTLSATSSNRVQWLRNGSTPEVEQVVFENSVDGNTWSALGAGTRISGGWELTGIDLSGSGFVRARGRSGNTASLIEQATD